MKKVILPALCAAFLSNCNQESPTPVESKADVGELKSPASALAVPDKFFTDATGDVIIMIRTCDFQGPVTAGKHCSYCAVDSGWVMIGGGAEIEGSPSPTARLRGSFPLERDLEPPVHSPDGSDKDCLGNSPVNDLAKGEIAWMARSDGTSAHRVRAYVVGLKIAGVSEEVLAGSRSIEGVWAEEDSYQPTVEAWNGSGGLLIGGGVDETGSQNCFITESRPNETSSKWRGTAYCSTPSSIRTFHVSINGCLSVPGWDRCLTRKFGSAVGTAGTGYRTASLTTSYPWVTSGIGGKGAVNLASSRFLNDILPVVGSDQGASVTSQGSVSGNATAYTVSLYGGRWGAWKFNSIRLNSAGTALHRPSGAAPVTLMQTTAFPDGAPYRWNLESLGSGQYRVRNSNPSNPASGECAYRQSGTSTLRVGPCTSANEHKWTVIGDLRAGTFQLKNVSSGTCLSNDNTYSNSALTLTTCANGYSTRQALFLDAFSWPQ